MASMTAQSNANQQPQQRAPTGPKPMAHWQIGDIAFLKSADNFSDTERAELLESRRVHTNATGHPVIILARSNDSRYYIVTTVSAYASGEYNNYLPPWEQRAHQRKDIDGFRAFEGSARPNNKFEPLRLADNKRWPKVETSWVYIHHPCLVPVTTLLRYTKSRSQLRMEPKSLQDLLGHMEAKCWKFREQKAEIMAKRTPNLPTARNPQQSWRRDDKENVRGPVISQANMASERPKLSDITNAAGNKSLYSDIAAKAIPQTKAQSCSRASRNQFAMLA
ncbi:hypothetical protein F5B21DRAFT_519633 [Xylaria acuta]|nr:hypothetical protein F5B21DRAFT_519633 [Xylaria acuta]